ncbi:hypothetical protein GOBAR_AA18270 [Gossypium barbadense]|uniref:Membrane-associated kinase regulator 4 n=1 Tax=Gossypium barbadense TaxID=3634 RepID=A0A2P5XGD4_GOSBA|nr:hypothetical protein GOBAR_AA18270 [Gossypium barbadense]
MAISQASSNHADEDYIDMEVSSSSNYLCYSISSPPQSREFEFQMCSVSPDGDITSTYPADELFYKGKLLPLHLPPRLQMVQKLRQSSNNSALDSKTQPPIEPNPAVPSTNTSFPLEYCTSISASESCRVSSELNADDYFFECSTEMNGFIGNGSVSKTSWCRKLMQIKQFSISQKLKTSRAYLKSLFSKSGCSDESCAKAACNVEAGNVSKNKDCVNKYMKMAKKNPFGKIDNERYKLSSIIMKTIDKEVVEDAANSHRRSNSASSEMENSIEGAIAHCKQSQQLSSSRKISVNGDQERPGFYSI